MTGRQFRPTFVVRAFLALLLALLGVSALLIIGPVRTASAYPDLATLTCPIGTSDLTYDPGIIFSTARTTDFTGHGHVGTCIGTGAAAGISFGDQYLSGSLTLTCDDLFSATVSITYDWNNSTSSTFLVTPVVTSAGSTTVATATGTVTGGIGDGDAVQIVTTYANTQLLACATSTGLTSLSGTQTLTIL
jgi:hypothetical protein